MCILLKLHYAKFVVSRLICSKVIEEKPLPTPPPPPLVKEALKQEVGKGECCLQVEGVSKVSPPLPPPENFNHILTIIIPS